MSSTFITRLKVGEILIDAKGVSGSRAVRSGIWPLVAARARRPAARSPSRSSSRRRCATDRVPRAAPAGPARHRLKLVFHHAARLSLAELLASRADVWSFVAEPHQLRGLVAGRRRGATRPARLRRGCALGAARGESADAPAPGDVERHAARAWGRRAATASPGRSPAITSTPNSARAARRRADARARSTLERAVAHGLSRSAPAARARPGCTPRARLAPSSSCPCSTSATTSPRSPRSSSRS